MADAYLPVTVRDLPIEFAIVGNALRPAWRSYVDQGVVRVIAGPEFCHIIIDVRRPYNRPQPLRMILTEAA